MFRGLSDLRPADASSIEQSVLRESEGARLFQAAVPEFLSGEWQYDRCQVRGVRKQRKKQIVHYRLSYRDQAGEGRCADVIGKVYGSDRGAKAYAVLQKLWEAGFRAPSRLRVPRAYGYSAARGTLLQGAAPGLPWAGGLSLDDRTLSKMSERAACWLVALQNSAVAGEAGQAREVADVQRLIAELGAAHPVWSAQLDDLGGAVAAKLPEQSAGEAPSHGDYHPKNVFLTPLITTVIDFDTFGLRAPAYDVGYAIGQLLIMSYFRFASFEAGVTAGQAFWGRYRVEGGRARWPDVSAHVARTFVQSLHYELCTLRNGRAGLLEMWSRMAYRWLSSNGEQAFEDTLRNL